MEGESGKLPGDSRPFLEALCQLNAIAASLLPL